MKKNILAIAIASAVAAPVAFADAPTVYGQMNIAIDSYSYDGGASGMNVKHRNSRLGVKGSEDLGNGLKAVYQMEATVDYGDGKGATDGTKATGFAMNRNTFVGVGGGFGTVVMGRHDSPLRMIQPNDGFADSAAAGNNTSLFNGGLAGEDRIDEVVAYLGKFGDISVAAALVGQDSLAGAEDDSLTHTNSFSLAYGSKGKGIYAAAAMTGETDSGRGAITRATVQYNEAGLLASFMYNAEADIGNSMTVGVAYKMGQITPRVKVAMVTYDAADATYDVDSLMNMAAGVDYSLGKNTSVYAEFASLAEGYREKASDATTSTAATTVMSVGLLHKF